MVQEEYHAPPGLPVRPNPGGPPGDSGDDGGGGDGPEESDEGTPVESDYDKRPPHKPAGDPNPDGHHDRDARLYKSMTINKWVKPIPKLDLPPRIHTPRRPVRSNRSGRHGVYKWLLHCLHGIPWLFLIGVTSMDKLKETTRSGVSPP